MHQLNNRLLILGSGGTDRDRQKTGGVPEQTVDMMMRTVRTACRTLTRNIGRGVVFGSSKVPTSIIDVFGLVPPAIVAALLRTADLRSMRVFSPHGSGRRRRE